MVEGFDFLGVGATVAFDGGGEAGAVGTKEGATERLPFLPVATGAMDEAELPEGVNEIVEHIGRAEPEYPRRIGGAFVLVECQSQAATQGRLLVEVGGYQPRLGKMLDAVAQGIDADGIAVAEPHKMTFGGGRQRGVGDGRGCRGIDGVGEKRLVEVEKGLDFTRMLEAHPRPFRVGPLPVEAAPQRHLLLEAETVVGHHTLQ